MTYSTPGVYLREVNAFGSGVVGVETAVPAFIGYTETAHDPVSGRPVTAPIPISSLLDYQAAFGGAAASSFVIRQTLSANPAFIANITIADGTVISSGFDLTLAAPPTGPDRFCLHQQMELFFANGGGACWVMSAGSHAIPGATVTASDLLAAIEAVGQIVGPTMLVVPEACQLPQADYANVACAMLDQAGRLQDRVAILDLPGCLEATNLAALTLAQQNLWSAIAPQADHLSYGAVYAPALATTVLQPRDVRFPVLAGGDNRTINAILTAQAVQLFSGPNLATVQSAIAAAFPLTGVTTNTPALSGDATAYPAPVTPGAAGLAAWQQRLDDLLTSALPIYVEIDHLVADYLNVQPASGAMAGVWTRSDMQSGVWSAPANITLAHVAAPLCPLGDADQGGFNVPVNGMAINLVRTFPTRGTVPWGARTLDGNSDDYRYVQVRRTLIYIEQSIKAALQQYVFAANDAGTWETVIASVSTFLTGLWRQGGLMGATATDAFSVQCGLGTTMNAQNVLDGYMVVTVALQMIHPAEFITLTFSQAMQAS
ncbi:phage tail sheath family protein [Sphingomonas sp. MMS24-J45]|uniref:phage tail sheath family protein n=1 Tax=Sphingomonas sp. MMS24-J45 TaxID=3238806 RepID=UPI00384C1E93